MMKNVMTCCNMCKNQIPKCLLQSHQVVCRIRFGSNKQTLKKAESQPKGIKLPALSYKCKQCDKQIAKFNRQVHEVVCTKIKPKAPTKIQYLQQLMKKYDDMQRKPAVRPQINTYQGYDGECPICCGRTKGRTVGQVPCGHQFHKECIEKWMRQASTCPVCRETVPEQNQWAQ